MDLPNELWLKVMDDLTTPDLYLFGSTSRHFNSLLFQHFWHTHRLYSTSSSTSSPLSSSDSPLTNEISLKITVKLNARRGYGFLKGHVGQRIDELDILSIISICIPATSAPRPHPIPTLSLTCEFYTGNLHIVPEYIGFQADDFNQLSSVLTRLQLQLGVAHINIILDGPNPQIRKSVTDETWVIRVRALMRLMNTCVEVRGCKSVGVHKGDVLGVTEGEIRVRHFKLSDLIPIPIGYGLGTGRTTTISKDVTRIGKGWRVYTDWIEDNGKIPVPSLSPSSTFEESNLTTFEINSPILVTPPFSHWTYQLIATASPSLTTLILTQIRYIDATMWKIVFTWLLDALKSRPPGHSWLTKLVLNDCYCSIFEPILHFLSHLSQTLEELVFLGSYYVHPDSQSHAYLGTTSNLHPTDFDFGIVRFPKLKALTASWKPLLALVGRDFKISYSKEEEEGLLEVVKGRFERVEVVKVEVSPEKSSVVRWER